MQVEFEGWWWVNDKRCSHALPGEGKAVLAAIAGGRLFEQILGVHLRRSRAPRTGILNLHTHSGGAGSCSLRAPAGVATAT